MYTLPGLCNQPTQDRTMRNESILTRHWDGLELEIIGSGVSGQILLLNDFRVVKVPHGTLRTIKEFEIERRIYCEIAKKSVPRVPTHVVSCFDFKNDEGIVLERLKESVRQRIRRSNSPPNEDDVWTWARQAAGGLAFIHRLKIIQGDVGCHNMLLDSSGDLKLCDFSGSSFRGSDIGIGYETRSQLGSGEAQPTVQSDIFALGSAMYEMAIGHAPYHDLTDVEVSQLYREGLFPSWPDDKDPRLGRIIMDCWQQHYSDAEKIVRDIDQVTPRSESRTGSFTKRNSNSIDTLDREKANHLRMIKRNKSRKQAPVRRHPQKRLFTWLSTFTCVGYRG